MASYVPTFDKAGTSVITQGILAAGTLTNAAVSVYTVPTGKMVVPASFILSNQVSSAALVSLWIVPPGETAVPQNRLMNNVSIPVKEIWNLTEHVGAMWTAATQIVMQSTTGTDFVNYQLTGSVWS
jgi:hypothetical protein